MSESANLNVRQFVIFNLGDEEYGIDIQKIATIEKPMPAARVPRTPAFVKGVINLRGEIIPVIDMRAKFNLAEAEETEDTRIIIIKIDDISVGATVDSVVEVLQIPESNIENITNFSSDISIDYILGVGKIDGRIVTLLNLEKLIRV